MHTHRCVWLSLQKIQVNRCGSPVCYVPPRLPVLSLLRVSLLDLFSFFLLLGISSGRRSCSAAPLSRPRHSFTAPHEPRRPACAPFVSRSANYCPGSRPQRSSRRQKVPPTSCKSFTSLALLSALIGQSPVGLKGRRRAAVQLTSSREKDWLAGLLSFTTTAEFIGCSYYIKV